MNLKKLSEKELHDIINLSSDVKLIAKAEDELIRRLPDYDPFVEEDQEEIMKEILKSWRAR